MGEQLSAGRDARRRHHRRVGASGARVLVTLLVGVLDAVVVRDAPPGSVGLPERVGDAVTVEEGVGGAGVALYTQLNTYGPARPP